MAQTLKRVIMVAALVGCGWVVGQAQTTQPDFEIVVHSPGGSTTVECVRGCDLSLIERGLNPNVMATRKFTYTCSAPAAVGCSSPRIGGWIRR
jgi:hypothetical protein